MPEKPERFDKVIVVGDVCVDVAVKIEDILTMTQKKEVPYGVTPGGTSGGASVALARMGVDTAFLGTIGHDYGGRYIREAFGKEGIDPSMMIEKEELNTINIFAFLDEK